MPDSGYLPIAVVTRPSFRLTSQRGNSRKRIEAISPDFDQLLALQSQLERLGYQFMRLERLEA
jgi:hypothetical protein